MLNFNRVLVLRQNGICRVIHIRLPEPLLSQLLGCGVSERVDFLDHLTFDELLALLLGYTRGMP